MLGDVIQFQRGFDLTEKEAEAGPYPVISSGGVSYSTSTAKVEGPGVVTGRKGVLGKVHFSEGPYWPHDTTLWVKDFKGNEPRFIYYWLHTLPLAGLDGGAANPTLNRNHAHLMPVRVPDRTTQRCIAGILSAIDDLIENARRRIVLLERMAQAIYREWFVHFRYPGHEDDELIDSPLGPIPSGWEVMKLGTVVETQYGFTDSATQSPVGPKFLRVMDINKRSYISWSDVPHCSPDVREKFRLREGDVVMARMADPGKIGIVERDVDAVFASYLVRLRPTASWLRTYYLYFVVSAAAYQEFALGASTGTTRKSISAKVMEEGLIIKPALDVLDTFVEAVVPLRAELTALSQEGERLSSLRDLLLPKLVTGAIDVSSLDLDALLADQVA
jgi:type I restriction enzyme S subunit